MRAQIALPHAERLRDPRRLVRQREEGRFGELLVRLEEADAPERVARQVQRQERDVQLLLLRRLLRQRHQPRAVAHARVQQQREGEVVRLLRAPQRHRDVGLADAHVRQAAPALRVVGARRVLLAELVLEERGTQLCVRETT